VAHANEFQFGPGVVGFRREKEAHILQRLAQAGRRDHLKIKIEPRTVGPAIARFGAGMNLGNDSRAQGTELDRCAFLPMAAPALSPLGEPGKQAAVIVQEGAGGPVLVGEQQRQKIAEPAEKNLVFAGKEFRTVGRFVAKTAHLEKIARTLLELGGIDAQIDLDAGLQRVEARFDFPDDAQFTARTGCAVLLAGREPVDQFLAEGIGFLRALLLLEVGAVEIRLE